MFADASGAEYQQFRDLQLGLQARSPSSTFVEVVSKNGRSAGFRSTCFAPRFFNLKAFWWGCLGGCFHFLGLEQNQVLFRLRSCLLLRNHLTTVDLGTSLRDMLFWSTFESEYVLILLRVCGEGRFAEWLQYAKMEPNQKERRSNTNHKSYQKPPNATTTTNFSLSMFKSFQI